VKKVGVLALQGAFIEHIQTFQKCGVEAVPVRLKHQLAEVEGLVLPGGESTTVGKLMVMYQIDEAIRRAAQEGMPIWGTCAGMILLAKEIVGFDQPHLDLMHIRVERNAFGRQLDSFEAMLDIKELGEEPFPAVFIRAPLIDTIGNGVEPLAELDDGRIVAAREGNLVVTSFHPELTDDLRFHRYFLDLG
jgi:pyridoxal 5'-phosphate synthase pdxT subunit